MKRFYAESDNNNWYIIDNEASPTCSERGYLNQHGRDRTDLDSLQVVKKFGYLTRTETKKLATRLVKKWNKNPPWKACLLVDMGPSPKYGFPVIVCISCQQKKDETPITTIVEGDN